MVDLESFLENYRIYMEEDYTPILHILSLLPVPYIYIFTLNLLEHESLLYAGDVTTGKKREGRIYYNDKKIILDVHDTTITLLNLPEPYDI